VDAPAAELDEEQHVEVTHVTISPVKKSQASRLDAWRRRKDQPADRLPVRGGLGPSQRPNDVVPPQRRRVLVLDQVALAITRRTVLDEIRKPSLSSSRAIR
jgi:hypothetical protein